MPGRFRLRRRFGVVPARYTPDLTLRVRFTSRRNPHQALRPFVHNVMRVHHPGQPAPVFVFTLTEVLAN